VDALLSLTAFFAAFVLDLVTKEWFVAHGDVIYNHRPVELVRRLAMSVVALAVTAALARLARWRGLGRIQGAWIGAGMLAGGVVGNGISPFVFGRGVPDFIDVSGGWVWNLADFEIVLGLLGGPLSIVVAATVTYARERLA
jgi:lipoprotein signal peptidase